MGLIAIVGPTAVGKTALAVTVAERLGNAELINADSRQVVRGLTVGTCAPTAAELRGVPCHLLALREPGEMFTVAQWLERARSCVDDLDRRGVVGIVVGGTGLYVDALIDGFETAGGVPDQGVRVHRQAAAATFAGREALARELCARDPSAREEIDLRNPRRVIRALEILDAGAGTIRGSRGRSGRRPAHFIGVDAERDLLDQLIRRRAAGMVHGGALTREVGDALARGVSPDDLAASGIGYLEALSLLRRETTPELAIDAIVARTRRYAKAQRTWFRRRQGTAWLTRPDAGADVEDLAGLVITEVAHLAGGRPRGR